MTGREKKGTKTSLQRPGRSKIRKFRGNRYTKQGDASDAQPSTSRKKLRTSEEFLPAVNKEFGYYLIEFFTVFNVMATVVKCKKCCRDVTFQPTKLRGLGFKIKVICAGECKPQFVNSGPFLKNGYEVNSRIVLAFRLLGIGWSGLTLFCGLMDMPSPVDKNTYLEIANKLLSVIQGVAERCMKKGTGEEKEETRSKNVFDHPDYVSMSYDGSWMKRGFTSLFGIVVVIGALTGKVLDITIKSAYCKVCEMWSKKEGTAEHEDYVDSHWYECQANHEGSSGKMEVTGTVQMFERSVQQRQCYYKNFIGDGDSKTYKAVLEANPYGDDCKVVKKECVGHVHKRMGTRLRNLVKTNKGLGGAGKLTGKQIDRLNDYYGRTIRNNSDDPNKMAEAIWATYYHRFSTDTKPQHQLCPKGADSWCDYQRAKAKKEPFKHTPKFTPPDAAKKIMTALKPIYTDLTKMELLERCTGAHTQNNNESFNSLVWQMAPKSKFLGAVHVQIAAYTAVCIFNEGWNTILTVVSEAGMTVGQNCQAACAARDAKRIADAGTKTAASTKQARIALRQARVAAHNKAEAE